MSDSTRPGLFLDKDGTLIENIPYNVDPARMRLVPGGGEAVRSLVESGFVPVVVTNQSGVARGRFACEDLEAVERRLVQLLRAHGVRLAAFYFCPHHPQGSVPGFDIDCDCRKPKPGLIERAASDLALDAASSWMIGDILDDVEAGKRAGCRAAFIDNGGETEWLPGEYRVPDLTAPDLPRAARAIIDRHGAGGARNVDAGGAGAVGAGASFRADAPSGPGVSSNAGAWNDADASSATRRREARGN